MSWKLAKLGEICTIEKGAIGIQKAIPGEYPLVVTGEDRKSHNEYQFENEAVIIPLVSGTGHGHASIKRIHFQTGKFALGNILCAVIPKNSNELNTEYLYRFLDLNKENELVARMKGMANVTLPIKEIAQIEIPIPSIEEQIEFVTKHKVLESQSNKLSTELTHQLTLVKKLRQQLLQDAVQGRFDFAQRPAGDETGAELLKKIKAEKQQLIAQGKLKKEKELPPIKAEEIPFEIPEGWVWCRLGEIALFSEAGTSYQAEATNATENEWAVIKTSAITSGHFLEEENKRLPKQIEDLSKIEIKLDDLLFCRASGSIGLAGKSCIVETITKSKLILSDKSIRYHFPDNISKKYIQAYNSSCFGELYYKNLSTKKSTTMNNITREQFNNLLIPLPPFIEQHRIVQKLDELMQTCDALEASIKASAEQNEKLLQQVLREALRKEVV